MPRTVRLRLTLLYGTLFVVSGAVLLTITYLLVTGATNRTFFISRLNGSPSPEQDLPPLDDATRQLREGAARQHAEQMHELLIQSVIALAIMTIVSIFLGWLVAGRVLRPLRTMTASIQQISARNVHERLAVDGPRDELRNLADTVDSLLGRLETALDAHKRFVANAAHELRTPLTLEHALLEETLTDRDATLETYRSTSERLLTISEQQGRLLESLLTLASSERGLDRREPIDLRALTDQALLAARPRADRLGLRIDATLAPAAISGDPALVERLVANLLDNALSYNIGGGRIEVTVTTDAVLRVANTGPVIPVAQVDRLFEPFQRLERSAHDDGHHGVGLSIVRAIATAHDAVLTARARPDGGLAVEVGFDSVQSPS